MHRTSVKFRANCLQTDGTCASANPCPPPKCPLSLSWLTKDESITCTVSAAVLGESERQEEQGNGWSLPSIPSHSTRARHKLLTKHQVLYRTRKLGFGKLNCVAKDTQVMVALGKKPRPIVCVPLVLCCQISLKECGHVNPRALYKGPGPPYPGTR